MLSSSEAEALLEVKLAGANPTLRQAAQEEFSGNKKLRPLVLLVIAEHPDWDLLKCFQYMLDKLKKEGE